MDPQPDGPAGRADHPRRGSHVPDIHTLMRLLKCKVAPRTEHLGSGNPNAVENQIWTRSQLETLFCQFLRLRGVSPEELNVRFEAPRGIRDQADVVVNGLVRDSGGLYYEWSGLRREYYYLMLLNAENRSPQMEGDMRSIHAAIEVLRSRVDDNIKEIISRSGTPYVIPDVFNRDMVIVKKEKPQKPQKRRK